MSSSYLLRDCDVGHHVCSVCGRLIQGGELAYYADAGGDDEPECCSSCWYEPDSRPRHQYPTADQLAQSDAVAADVRERLRTGLYRVRPAVYPYTVPTIELRAPVVVFLHPDHARALAADPAWTRPVVETASVGYAAGDDAVPRT